MDEDIAIINAKTRNQRIKDFFINNKKKIIILFSILVLIIFGYFFYDEYKKRNKLKLADKFNILSMKFISGNEKNIEKEMIKIVESKDKTYSPLALYFLIDHNLIDTSEEINRLFDIIINETKLDKEIKNLNIYKKALYNSEFSSENDLIKILNPLINSDNIWKSHSLYLLAEYFLSKGETIKSKEFLQKILIMEDGDPKIKLEARKRIERDFSE